MYNACVTRIARPLSRQKKLFFFTLRVISECNQLGTRFNWPDSSCLQTVTVVGWMDVARRGPSGEYVAISTCHTLVRP